ncbi:MAG: SDR family NAD(P)-dependent oxidoreductase, partial [Thiotrichales bacterium]|nr:SDR family NAD(P)-dependent oxidoreductase [Thiotrichales bacterium]
MNAIDLKGRSAIVTGGAQGIGRAITERLLASGAAVALWDRDAELLAGTARQLADRGEVSTATVDVTDAEGVAGAFAATAER